MTTMSPRYPGRLRPASAIAKIIIGGHRLEVILRLAVSPCDVTKVADDLELGIVTISQNLRILADHGLVMHQREGKRRIYSLTPTLLVQRDKRRIVVSYEDNDGYTFAIGASTSA